LRLLANLLPENLREYRRVVLVWGLIGYLIRVTVIPIGYSIFSLWFPLDMLTNGWISFILMERHELVAANNPPLVYYLLALIYTLLGPIFPRDVFYDVSMNVGFTPVSLANIFRTSQEGFLRFVFLTKMSFMFFDFASALLLLWLIDGREKALLAFKLWMANPIIIYVSYLIGTYHIIAIPPLILALYLLKKGKIGKAMISLGLSGAIEPFFLLFVPFITLISLKHESNTLTKLKKLLLLLLLGLLPFLTNFLLSRITPVYYEAVNAATRRDFDFNGFYGRVLYYRGQPVKNTFLSGLFLFLLEYSSSIVTLPGFTDTIYLIPLIYTVFLLGIMYYSNWSFQKIWRLLLVFSLTFYSFALFHTHWFLWVQPFLILLVVEDRGKYLMPYIALLILVFIYSGYWNLEFIKLIESIGLPGIRTINLFRSIMSGVMVFIAYLVLRDIKRGSEK